MLKRRKNLLIIGITLFTIIVGFFIFSWFYFQNDKKKKMKEMQEVIQEVTYYRDSIQTPFNQSVSKFDSFTENNSNVKSASLQRILEIDTLKTNIKTEMNKIHTDSTDAKLKHMVSEFNQQVDTLINDAQDGNR